MKFRNLKDHAISFHLHHKRVEVAAKAEFEVADHHAFAVSSMGLPVEVVAIEIGPLPDAPEKPVKGPDGKFVKKSA